MLLEKVSPAELNRVEELRAQQYRRILSAFISFINETHKPGTLREIRQLLEVGDYRGAAAIIDTHVEALSNVLPQTFISAATQEVSAAADKLKLVVHKAAPKASIAVGFDPSNERAASLMRSAKLQFIQQFTNSQRAATRVALASSFSGNASIKQATNSFKNSIGLTDTQMQAVESYRKLLERGSLEALKRSLRDRRYDRAVERADETEAPLTADQIDRMVDRYRARYLQYRAGTIARTEALTITSMAQQEALEQIVSQTGVDPSRVQRVWNSTKDARTRDSHREMDGQVVGMHQPFVSGLGNQLMFPGDSASPAADRINCRCTVTVRILPE